LSFSSDNKLMCFGAQISRYPAPAMPELRGLTTKRAKGDGSEPIRSNAVPVKRRFVVTIHAANVDGFHW
jgi:hypothetical protein